MRGISLETARTLCDAVLAEARRTGLPPLAVVVLDAGGLVKCVACEDGTGTLRYQIAHAKANAAIGMGMSTRSLFDLFENGVLADRFSNSIVGAAGGAFAPQPGGELIMAAGNILGAIGASGASSGQDEAVIRTALAKSSLI